MRRAILLFAVAASLTAAASKVSRAELLNLERAFDRRLAGFDLDDPFDRLGDTRGFYIDNIGVVLSAELSLVVVPQPTPFRPEPGKENVERLRQRKIARMPQLRQLMRDMMVTTATALRGMPPEETVAIGVTLFYQPWEDVSGLPRQVVLQARRKVLVDYEAGKLKNEALNAAIQEQVY